MDIEQLSSLGWREGLIAIIALLVLYIIVLFVRMRHLRRDLQASRLAGTAKAAEAAVAAYTAVSEPPPDARPTLPVGAPGESVAADAAPLAVSAGAVPVTETAELPAEPGFAWNEPPPEIPGQALIDALQRDMYQLRCELDELRSDLLAAREDVRRVLAEAAQPVATAAPLYKDAMQLAMQGHDAAAIARHCAIARAEADLIVALARNRPDGIQ